jgi:hypothetical protein
MKSNVGSLKTKRIVSGLLALTAAFCLARGVSAREMAFAGKFYPADK